MCGILGKVTFRGSHEPPEVFDRALAQLDHRGPDDRGAWHHTLPSGIGLSLGQTRLSILDLSPAGHQPMFSPRTGSCVVFNGEVYNFREVRAGLESKGLAFTSQGDTEVVLAAYDDRGESFMEPFRGMFAIAVWDQPRQKLVLVRDRLGIKPLYYYWDGRQFAFASEVTALAALPGLELEVNHEAVRQFLLHGYIPAPLSIFRNVRKLPAGHLLTLEMDRPAPAPQRYWNALDYYANPRTFRDEGEVLEAIRAELTEAVRLRLISDVPLGAFLSGGVDSSLVVALMRQAHTGPLRTFTIGFTVPEWNEAPAAKRIAEHLGTEHEELYLSEQNILDTARSASEHYDEPFADPSNIPTLALCRLTRQRVTVALSGDGGDELFWGYDRYTSRALAWHNVLRSIPRPLRRAAAWGSRLGNGTRFGRWGEMLRFEDFPAYYVRAALWQPGYYRGLHPHLVEGNRLLAIGREVTAHLGESDPDMLTGAIDLHGYLVDDILTKVDRASMSVALEARVPILDHKVVQLAASIPSSLKTHGGELKHLLRALLGQLVPRELWDRPKMGFGIPLVHWFRTSLKEWAYDELDSRGGRLHEWLDRRELRAMLDDHVSGRRDVSALIWGCLQLPGWDRRMAGLSPPAAPPVRRFPGSGASTVSGTRESADIKT